MNQCEQNYRMKMILDCVILEKPLVWRRQSCHTLPQALGNQNWARRAREVFPEKGALFTGP